VGNRRLVPLVNVEGIKGLSRDNRITTEVREFIERLTEGATLPPVAIRLTEVTKDPDYGLEQVAPLLTTDQALAAKVLRIANSAHFGQPGRVESLSRAAVLLGSETIRIIALSVLVVDAFRVENGRFFKIRDFWYHNIACAIAAELLARRFESIHPETAFVAGLLHDIGKVALYQWNPDYYDQVVEQALESEVPLIEKEEELIGIPHTQAGKILLENWGLPQPITAAAWLHHQPFARPAGELSNEQIPFLIKCANNFVHIFRMGSSGDRAEMSQTELMNLTALSLREVERLSIQVLRRFEEVSGYFDWDVSSPELYLSAVTRANQELGDRQLKLVIQNRELNFQNKVAETMCNLLQEAGRTRSAGTSLAKLAQLASRLVPSKRVLAFMPDLSRGGLLGRIVNGDSKKVDEAFLPVSIAKLSETRLDLTLIIRNSLPDNEKAAEQIRESLDAPGLLSIPVSCAGRAHAQIMVDTERTLTPQEQEGMKRFAQTAGLFLEHQALLSTMEEQLEHVARGARQADQYRTKLYEADRLASVGRLAAGAAHEINNPLTTISTHAQLLERSLEDEKTKKALRTIIDQTNRISKIIEDLMGVARPARPHWETTNIRDVVASTLQTLEDRIRVSGVEIKQELDVDLPVIAADPHQLEQVFVNLVLNALEATEPGGLLTIRARVEPKGERVEIEFEDTGRGIEPDKLPMIFEPFYTTKGGTGLGLAIAKKLVEGHGGEIQVTSSHKGSKFSVFLPTSSTSDEVRPKKEKAIQEAEDVERAPNRASILVIDDEDELRNVLAESLQLEGYSVDVAADGEEGLGKLETHQFDLALLDLRVPRKQALEVLKLAREKNPDLKFIVIIGLARSEELDAALQAGAFSCLKKPFTMDELLGVVREALSE